MLLHLDSLTFLEIRLCAFLGASLEFARLQFVCHNLELVQALSTNYRNSSSIFRLFNVSLHITLFVNSLEVTQIHGYHPVF